MYFCLSWQSYWWKGMNIQIGQVWIFNFSTNYSFHWRIFFFRKQSNASFIRQFGSRNSRNEHSFCFKKWIKYCDQYRCEWACSFILYWNLFLVKIISMIIESIFFTVFYSFFCCIFRLIITICQQKTIQNTLLKRAWIQFQYIYSFEKRKRRDRKKVLVTYQIAVEYMCGNICAIIIACKGIFDIDRGQN